MIASFDTNVLVYACDPAAGARHDRAVALLARAMRGGDCVLLLQTLAEFAHVATRRVGADPGDVLALIESWQTILPVREAAGTDLPAALGAVRDHNLSFWDAMLWATADRVGVRWLLTEDFQDGRKLSSVRFVNPFAPKNDETIDRIFSA